jgi:hypothetical protein
LVTDGQSQSITTVVRSANDMRALVETWRGGLLENGWK